MNEKKITIEEASEISGIPQQTLRIGLRNGKFDFGTAFKLKEGSKRWKYIIYPSKFYECFQKKEGV